MNILVNALVEWQEPEDGKSAPRIERVLSVDKADDRVLTIDVLDDKAWVIRRSHDALVRAITASDLRVLESEIFPELLRAENDIKQKHREIRDALHVALAPLIDHEGEEYLVNSRKRGAKIAKLARDGEIGMSKPTIYKHFRRYLQAGRRKNAFLPSFARCGAPGERRIAKRQDAPKPGQRSALGRATGRAIGIRITAEIERKFERGIKRFYKDKSSLRDAHELTLREYFYRERKVENGKLTSIMPPTEELPTLRQFRYWYETVYRNPVKEKIRIHGEREYLLTGRELLGDSTQQAFAPGSLYQIDSTISDVHLVNSLDPLRIIGRPVVYVCMDVFSHAVAGLYVTLESASWTGAMLALDDVVADKVALCAEYGVEITDEMWPIRGLPQAICADRGEFEGYNANNLVNSFGMRVDTTAPYRADWKAIVERQFGLAKDRVVKFIPGFIHQRVRGDPDYRLGAAYTLDDFRQLLIAYVIDYNTSFYLENYRKDEFMIADHVERYPLALWRWGVENRGGALGTLPRDVVRLNLLPRKTVSVTSRGIHFERELYYVCDLALREQWFDRARIAGEWRVEVGFDPRRTNHIYLITDGGQKIERCHLTAASDHLKDRDWHDVVDYFELERQAKEVGGSRRLQSRVTLRDTQEQITNRAVERKKAALLAAGEVSKKTLVGGMRENRAEERERARDHENWTLGDPDPVPSIGNLVPETDAEDEEDVAAPSMIDRLRPNLDAQWEGDNDQH